MNAISPATIKRSVVLHLCPATLAKHGARFTFDVSVYDSFVEDRHYFVIVFNDRGVIELAPCFTNRGPTRSEVTPAEKSGHYGWTQRSTHVDLGQRCRASIKAIGAAAEAGNDLSVPGSRNRISDAGMERLFPVGERVSSSTAA